MRMSKDYIEELRKAIQHTHGCLSTHLETVPVREELDGKVAWDGDVEVFWLVSHAQASRCYAWGFKDDAGKWQYVAVLQVPQVDTPRKAVQAYVLSQEDR